MANLTTAPLNKPLLQTTMALIPHCFKTQHYAGNKCPKTSLGEEESVLMEQTGNTQTTWKDFFEMLVCKPQNKSG